MLKTPEEQLAHVERDIALHREADHVEQVRRDREYHSWTPQDRADWKTARAADAERLREMLTERGALRRQLGKS